MTDMVCTYSGNRDETIAAYLYDDITPLERAAFDAHVAGCAVCRDELASLRGVRTELAAWAPPAFSLQSFAGRVTAPAGAGGQSSGGSLSWWATVPAWAQAVAAMLVLGVAAGAANLNVHHDASGFTVRTGWMQASAPVAAAQDDQAPVRAELARLESELRAVQSADARVVSTAVVAPPVARPAASDDDVLRQAKALIAESEKREQSELALRIAQVARDRQTERIADLGKIERALGVLQSNTGFVVARQSDAINSLAMRVSQTVR